MAAVRLIAGKRTTCGRDRWKLPSVRGTEERVRIAIMIVCLTTGRSASLIETIANSVMIEKIAASMITRIAAQTTKKTVALMSEKIGAQMFPEVQIAKETTLQEMMLPEVTSAGSFRPACHVLRAVKMVMTGEVGRQIAAILMLISLVRTSAGTTIVMATGSRGMAARTTTPVI